MESKQRRAKAEQTLGRLNKVVASCLRLADEGNDYFAGHRDEYERLRVQLLPFASGDAGTKRLVALSRDLDGTLERLERRYVADRERRVAEARAADERERHQRLVDAKVAELKRRPRPAPVAREETLGIRFDMRNE